MEKIAIRLRLKPPVRRSPSQRLRGRLYYRRNRAKIRLQRRRYLRTHRSIMKHRKQFMRYKPSWFKKPKKIVHQKPKKFKIKIPHMIKQKKTNYFSAPKADTLCKKVKKIRRSHVGGFFI